MVLLSSLKELLDPENEVKLLYFLRAIRSAWWLKAEGGRERSWV